MNQTLKNGKKKSFGPNFGPFWPKLGHQKYFWQVLPPLDVRHRCQLLSYTTSRTTKEQNLRKWQKTQFRDRFWPIWPKFGPPTFFKNILPSLVTRYYGQLSSCTISEKNDNSIQRKLSDGQTDRPPDRRVRVISYDAVRLTSSVKFF